MQKTGSSAHAVEDFKQGEASYDLHYYLNTDNDKVKDVSRQDGSGSHQGDNDAEAFQEGAWGAASHQEVNDLNVSPQGEASHDVSITISTLTMIKLKSTTTMPQKRQKTGVKKFEHDGALLFIRARDATCQMLGSPFSKFSEEEARIALNLIKDLLDFGFDPAEIGIVSPYIAQSTIFTRGIAQLARQFSKLDFSNLLHETIDSSQGKERNIGICSLTVGSKLGHLTDSGRLNVGLSRFRYGLVIIGNSLAIASAKEFKDSKMPRLFSHLVTKKCIIDWHEHGPDPTKALSLDAILPSTADADDGVTISNAELEACRNCKQIGHVAKDCTEPKVCEECSESGHERRDCPVTKERKLAERECYRCRRKGSPCQRLYQASSSFLPQLQDPGTSC